MREVNLLTDRLLQIGDISSAVIGSGQGAYREFELETGTAIGWTLFKNDNVHCMRAFLSQGTIFPLHEHQLSAETIILYKGSLEIHCGDVDCDPVKIIMAKGKPVYLEAAENHKLIALADSWVITTLIPPDKQLD